MIQVFNPTKCNQWLPTPPTAKLQTLCALQIVVVLLLHYWTCSVCVVGQVVHTLPEGELVWGVTSLGDEVYVLRPKGLHDVEV